MSGLPQLCFNIFWAGLSPLWFFTGRSARPPRMPRWPQHNRGSTKVNHEPLLNGRPQHSNMVLPDDKYDTYLEQTL
jgi:hypothetical protein